MSSQKGLISSKGGALWSSNGYVATGREERERERIIANDKGKINSYVLIVVTQNGGQRQTGIEALQR